MNIAKTSPVRRAFPLVDIGEGFHEIRNSNGKVLFELHQVDPAKPFYQGLSGTFIAEEVGVAYALLPDDFLGKSFEDLEAAYAYCVTALEALSASLNGKMAA